MIIEASAIRNIEGFYKAYARKHRFDYSIQMMLQNINEVIDGIKTTTNGRTPMLERHRNLGYLEHPFTRKKGLKFDWYVEFKNEVINEEEVIHVYEVLHKSQMHEEKDRIGEIITEQINRFIKEDTNPLHQIEIGETYYAVSEYGREYMFKLLRPYPFGDLENHYVNYFLHQGSKNIYEAEIYDLKKSMVNPLKTWNAIEIGDDGIYMYCSAQPYNCPYKLEIG